MQSRPSRPLNYTALALAILFVFVAIGLFGAIRLLTTIGSIIANPCGETTIQRASSPDGKLEALIVEVDCGATTNYARHVRLHSRNPSSTSSSKDNVAVVAGQGTGKIVWKSPTALSIEYDSSDAEFFEKKSESMGTHLSYIDIRHIAKQSK